MYRQDTWSATLDHFSGRRPCTERGPTNSGVTGPMNVNSSIPRPCSLPWESGPGIRASKPGVSDPNRPAGVSFPHVRLVCGGAVMNNQAFI